MFMLQFVSEFCKLDLSCSVPGCGPQEIRALLLEGGLRLKDTYAKVWIVLLFTYEPFIYRNFSYQPL